MPKKVREDFTGRVIGRLTVVEPDGCDKHGNAAWKCKCECGNECKALALHLKRGVKKSCGKCGLRKESCQKVGLAKRTHGHSYGESRTPEYDAWSAMKQRCTNPKSRNWKHYGGRGITVCERWMESFENFLADMGPRPSSNHQIDRINNNLGYSPENCKWRTVKENQNNRRNNNFLTLNGVTKSLGIWSGETGISVSTLWKRKFVYGWSDESCLTCDLYDLPKPRKDAVLMTLNGKTLNIPQWSRIVGIKERTLRTRKASGMSDEQCLTTPVT